MFDWSVPELIFIMFLLGPAYFWYVYVVVLFISIMLIRHNKKKENIKNKIFFFLGWFLTIFTIINCICTGLFILSWVHR